MTGTHDGVGLGLAVARLIVTTHHATVTARSQPDGGLDISVVIPRLFLDLNRLDLVELHSGD